MVSGLERRFWKRVAISFAAVSLLLVLGKLLPLPGIPSEIFAETIRVCRTGITGLIGIPWLYVCHGPMLPHKELLETPLLGSVAILAFLAIWLRRRLTN